MDCPHIRGSRASAGELEPKLHIVVSEHAKRSGWENPRDLLGWDFERLCELRDDSVSHNLSRPKDDALGSPRGDRAHRARHDLSMALVLDLANCDLEGDVMDVVPLSPDHEGAPREELPALRLLADLLREDPERTPAGETRRPRFRIDQCELAGLPQRRLA